MAQAHVRVGDGGIIELRGFGLRRIKAIALLAEHPELDADGWRGEAQLHFGKGTTVLGAIHPMPSEISLDSIAS